MTDDKYLFSQVPDAAEFERLQIQEEALDWLSYGLLTRLGIAEGHRCVELGVGAGSMARWMASRVGDQGEVVALDTDDRFFGASIASNIVLRKEDVRTSDIESESMDFIHCRMLLQYFNDDDRARFLRRALNWLKPGGWVVALVPAFDWPSTSLEGRADQLWQSGMDISVRAAASSGDSSLGRRLPVMLRDAGFEVAGSSIHVGFALRGSQYQLYALNTLDVVIRLRLLDAMGDDVHELRQRLAAGEVIGGFPLGIAWAQRRG